MYSEPSCCTCAAFLSTIPLPYNEKSEKPAQHERRLDCCDRIICARCITDNPRFARYCPYCQTTDAATAHSELLDPPKYSPSTATTILSYDELPPPYTDPQGTSDYDRKGAEPAPDVLHFVNVENDSITSLSLQYGVPAPALRRANGLYSDHLLHARRTVIIPGEYYKGAVSLSPRPVEGEEEETRKSKIRRWMVACKVAEYVQSHLEMLMADY